MRIIHLTFKDLLQVLRDKKSVFFMVLMPIAFTLFFGFIMSGSISDPRLPVGWINADEESILSADLFHMLEKSNVIRPVSLEGSEASRASDQVRMRSWLRPYVCPQVLARRPWRERQSPSQWSSSPAHRLERPPALLSGRRSIACSVR